jgi:hypothetical protein
MKTKVQCIKDFFEMDAKSIMAEFKPLSQEDRLELAQGSAKNLGLTQEQVDFPLA